MTKLLASGAARMQKLKLGKGAVGKDFWQINAAGTDPHRRHRGDHRHLGVAIRKRPGCCARLRMYEENARFLMLAVIMLAYLFLGALIFHSVESEHELFERNRYSEKLNAFRKKYCRGAATDNSTEKIPNASSRKPLKPLRFMNCTELEDLLDLKGNLSAAGLTSPRLKWDWSGAFYFVGTVVSTIGFGMTTPRTNAGKALVICYGFFGCAGAILLFNLFLERIITLFAHTLRFVHDQRERRLLNARKPTIRIVRTPDSDDASSEASMEQWRPSVYVVMACLFVLSVTLILIAASLYTYSERWTYFEAVYFCFVSFATIGFGDYVSSQQQSGDGFSVHAYRAANFLFLTLGCCCIYSLFNVTSIVIRQFLNRLLRVMDCRCQTPKCFKHKQRPYLGLGLRPPKPDHPIDSDSEGTPSRRTSADGGIMSLKEFLEMNKMNIFLMQKHIIESAQKKFQDNLYDTSSAISASAVGPLAILNQQFGED